MGHRPIPSNAQAVPGEEARGAAGESGVRHQAALSSRVPDERSDTPFAAVLFRSSPQTWCATMSPAPFHPPQQYPSQANLCSSFPRPRYTGATRRCPHPGPPLFFLFVFFISLLFPLSSTPRKPRTSLVREGDTVGGEWEGERERERDPNTSPSFYAKKERKKKYGLELRSTQAVNNGTTRRLALFNKVWARRAARVAHAQTPGTSRMILRRALSSWSDQSVSSLPTSPSPSAAAPARIT